MKIYQDKYNKLNQRVNAVLIAIDEARKEFENVGAISKQEYFELEDAYVKTKIKLIDNQELIEGYKDDLSALKMIVDLQKQKGDFFEEPFEKIVDKIRQLEDSIEAAVKNNRSYNLKRCELELNLFEVKRNYDYADKLLEDFNIAYEVISGDIKKNPNQIIPLGDEETIGVKVLKAQEAERKRIARDMHDGPTQNLSNLLLKTELCIKLMDKDIDRTKLELNTLKLLIRATIDDTRRLIHNLRPMSIDDLGLIPTMDRMIDEIQSELDMDIDVEYQRDLNLRVDPIVILTIYRISQEAMNNIKKHSKATSVKFNLELEESFIVLNIRDNGVGFNIDDIELYHEDNRGFGISMMRERTILLGGHFQLCSTPDAGTDIIVKLPILLKKEV